MKTSSEVAVILCFAARAANSSSFPVLSNLISVPLQKQNRLSAPNLSSYFWRLRCPEIQPAAPAVHLGGSAGLQLAVDAHRIAVGAARLLLGGCHVGGILGGIVERLEEIAVSSVWIVPAGPHCTTSTFVIAVQCTAPDSSLIPTRLPQRPSPTQMQAPTVPCGTLRPRTTFSVLPRSGRAACSAAMRSRYLRACSASHA